LITASLLQPILIGNSWVCKKQYFMTQQGQALPGYCISLALVMKYPHFICRKLSATRNGEPEIEFG
jgi:hypothetical protein